jgi:hypothetical protein
MQKKFQQLCFWTSLWALIIIHAIDMQLTQHFIGDNYENEVFKPMSLAIQYIGIYPALWLSRITMYLFFFLVITNRGKDWCRYLTFLMATLYWSAMTNWLYTLRILQ